MYLQTENELPTSSLSKVNVLHIVHMHIQTDIQTDIQIDATDSGTAPGDTLRGG